METIGKICAVEGSQAFIVAPVDPDFLKKQHVTQCVVYLNDGRTITAEQRKKAYATLRDIADWCGHLPEFLKQWFKYEYVMNGGEYFSLSDCSVTVAREYINLLTDFCLRYGVPVKEPLTQRTDDIDTYLYQCLTRKKCAVCGRRAEIHHVTGSKIGMGGNRKMTSHIGRHAIALCRIHHMAAHENEREFFEKNHVYGIPLDHNLCKRLNLYGGEENDKQGGDHGSVDP